MVLKSACRLIVAAGFFASAHVGAQEKQDLRIASSGPQGFGFALECGRCGSQNGALWRFSELPLIVAVADRSAAARGGMQPGDTLISIDGFSLLTEAGARRFAGVSDGARTVFTVGREGRRVDIPLTPPRVASRGSTCIATNGPRGSTQSSIESKGSAYAKWTVSWKSGDCVVELKADGSFSLRPDLSDVETLGDGSSFGVNVREGKMRRELAIRSDRGQIVHEWKVDGNRETWTDESRRWLGELLVDLDRRTAFAIDVRFPQLFNRGATAAVLDEIALMTGDFARSAYFRRLADSARLTVGDIQRVLEHIDRYAVNDFARRQVLTTLQRQPAGRDTSLTAAYIRAARGMSSIMRASTLESIARRGPLSSEALAAFIETLMSQGAGMEATRVYETLIRSNAIRPADLEVAIAATGRVQSEMLRGRVLELFASRYQLEGAARQAYVTTARSIQSRMIRDRVLAAVVERER